MSGSSCSWRETRFGPRPSSVCHPSASSSSACRSKYERGPAAHRREPRRGRRGPARESGVARRRHQARAGAWRARGLHGRPRAVASGLQRLDHFDHLPDGGARRRCDVPAGDCRDHVTGGDVVPEFLSSSRPWARSRSPTRTTGSRSSRFSPSASSPATCRRWRERARRRRSDAATNWRACST